MRIAESNVQLKSEREASSGVEIKRHFTQTFGKVLESQAAAQDSQERLVKMLESLVEAILAALEGKNCRSGLRCCRTSDIRAADFEMQRGREIEWRGELTTTRFETEHTSVEGQGTVRTKDGRSIEFNLCMDMERRYRADERDVHGGKITLRDPLVINFDDVGAALSAEKVAFDLDADGQDERIPGLVSGSGYLVFDRNHNGRADDGSELFGTSSGNGFADMTALDSDGNGWIDESDAGFKDLFIWRGGQESGSMQNLLSAGVGALWTGSVTSPFALKDSANMLLGEIRGTGVWLNENTGQPGAIQQVDLAAEK